MRKLWINSAAILLMVGAAHYALTAHQAYSAPIGAGPSKAFSEMITDRIDEIRVGEPQTFGGLTVFPLIGRSIGGLDYLTLDEAMNRGLIKVTERDSGEVNRITLRNLSGRRVFIMDGEEVVGAKQNRVVNTSVLIAPRQIAEIPVSCVEHGRWTAESPAFKSGGTQLFARARQINAPAVSGNLARRPSAGAMSDQQGIWDKVGEKRAKLSVGAASGPMHEAYDRYTKSIDDYVRRFRTVDKQVGALFAIDGEIVGADIFDQSSTLDRLFTKMVKSYALDAIEKREVVHAPRLDSDDARSFLRLAQRPDVSFRDYDSPGEGRDVRITSGRINGASLVAAGRSVHIALFAPTRYYEPMPAQPGNLRPPSERRGYRGR